MEEHSAPKTDRGLCREFLEYCVLQKRESRTFTSIVRRDERLTRATCYFYVVLFVVLLLVRHPRVRKGPCHEPVMSVLCTC